MKNHYDFRVIIIDDNPAIHYDFIKILTNPPASREFDELDKKIFGGSESSVRLPLFQIDTANQGQKGIEIVAKAYDAGERYTLAFIDVRMPPGMDGIETIKQIWQIDPDIQIVICTAFTDYSWEETIAALGHTDNLIVIKKPFDTITVRQIACALSRKWQLTQETKHYMSSLEHRIQESAHCLQQSISLARATMDSSADGILVADTHGKIVDYNNKFLSMWGIKRSNLLKTDSFNILNKISKDSLDPNKFTKKVKEINEHSDTISIDVVKLKDGRTFEFYSQPQKLADKTVGRVWSFRDISQRITLEQKLQYSTTHDLLTGLPNHFSLKSILQKVANAAQANNNFFAVLFLDLDHFKLINDNFGSVVGDELLCTIADNLKNAIRSCDSLVRMNGDEFVVVLSDLATKDSITNIANKLLEIISKPIKLNKREVIITASMGISIYPKDTKNVDILLTYADSAINYAKKAGGNQVKYHNKKMNENCIRLLEQETELRRAIINNEFYLCYQPQIDMNLNTVVAVEALIRWNHPEKGLLFPLDFIPLAEHTGLIIPIGEWILRTACMQAKHWQDAGLKPIRVAVNITAEQLNQYDFVKTVVDTLEQTQLAPEHLELELTENMLINNPESIKILNALKEIGVSLALDDFGTGYSSLNNLRKMAIDRLKIDSSFIQNIQLNHEDEAIIRSIIDIANNMNLEVLAEGVESKNQVDFLKSKKVGQIQGFYFSHALTTDELETILREKTNINQIFAK